MPTTLENTLIRFNDGTTQSTAATTPAAASTSVAGISRFATNAEVTTGTATTIGITPAGLASFAKSLDASGYALLPGGLIIQWGAAPTSGSYTTVTFPLSFPSACRSVVCTLLTTQAGQTSDQEVRVNTLSVSSFRQMTVLTTANIHWIAIGY